MIGVILLYVQYLYVQGVQYNTFSSLVVCRLPLVSHRVTSTSRSRLPHVAASCWRFACVVLRTYLLYAYVACMWTNTEEQRHGMVPYRRCFVIVIVIVIVMVTSNPWRTWHLPTMVWYPNRYLSYLVHIVRTHTVVKVTSRFSSTKRMYIWIEKQGTAFPLTLVERNKKIIVFAIQTKSHSSINHAGGRNRPRGRRAKAESPLP